MCVRSALNLTEIYDTRREWIKGNYNYNKLLNKSEISQLLDKNLVAVEGLDEINEEDVKKYLKD